MNQGIEIMLHTFNVMTLIKKKKKLKWKTKICIYSGTGLNLQVFVFSLLFTGQSRWVDNMGKGRRPG